MSSQVIQYRNGCAVIEVVYFNEMTGGLRGQFKIKILLRIEVEGPRVPHFIEGDHVAVYRSCRCIGKIDVGSICADKRQRQWHSCLYLIEKIQSGINHLRTVDPDPHGAVI